MTLKKINVLIAKKDELTEKEKEELIQRILTNKKAKEKAINGAIGLNNLTLAVRLMYVC